jgi:hypothetical protein
MTDSELQGQLEQAIQMIREAVEERGGMLEIDKKLGLSWLGTARLPSGKLMLNCRKTGRHATPEDTKPVIEMTVDLTFEGRLVARLLFYSTKTELELPGGTHKPFGHAGIARAFQGI